MDHMTRLAGRRGSSPKRPLRAVTAVLGLVVAIFAIALAVALAHGLTLEHQLSGVPAALDSAETEIQQGQIARAEAKLRAVQAELDGVDGSLYNSLDFTIAGVLPVAHQNLAAARDTVSMALRTVTIGQSLLQAAAPLTGPSGRIDVPLRAGRVPLTALAAIRSSLDQATVVLPQVQPRTSALVLGRIASIRTRVYSQAVIRRKELVSVDQAISLLADIAGANGDRRYLVVASNSAEMRGTGGMYLSYGVISSHAGKLTISAFHDTADINLHTPETAVPFPSDVQKTLGPLDPAGDWREVNLVSDYTVDAPVMVAMYRQATGVTVNGVLQVDPFALAAVLAVTGPITTPDIGTVDASNAVALILNQAYFEYPERTKRQDYMGEAAQTAFGRLLGGNLSSLRSLAQGMLKAGRQRHLLLYTTDPSDEQIVTELGLAGGLPTPGTPYVSLTVQNAGGSKLDYYLRTSLALDGARPSEVGSPVTATVDLANTAPVGMSVPAEVFGAGPTPGTYTGFVTLYLPTGSRLMSSRGDATVTSAPAQSSQNGVPVVTYTVSLAAGAQSHLVLTLLMGPTPAAGGSYRWVPSPRVIQTRFTEHLG